MSNELYKKYRPKTLKELVGQDAAVAQIRKLLGKSDFPHTWLLAGIVTGKQIGRAHV